MSFPDDVVFTEAAVSYGDINMESDISQMEAPTFTTIDRGAPQAMLDLQWDHKLNLVGKKVVNPMIHCCDKCKRPILIYGRMIPCKHVFCLACGKEEVKTCPRCGDKVSRVEQGGLGNIFLCTEGGSRYGNTGCRRTYLSSRDLQAHIAHRHGAKQKVAPTTPHGEKTEAAVAPVVRREETGGEGFRNNASHISTSSLAAAVAAVNSANFTSPSMGTQQQYSTPAATGAYNTPPPGTHAPSGHGSHISVLTTRQSNLISVPIQGGEAGHPAPAPGTGSPAAGYNQAPGFPPRENQAPGYPPSTGYPAYTTTASHQPGTQAYSQPPPAMGYGHQYGAGYSTTAAGQYPGAVQAPGGVQAPAPAGYTAPSAGGQQYQGAPPAGGQQYQGQGAPPAGGQQYQGQWSRPPPPGPPASGYYRR